MQLSRLESHYADAYPSLATQRKSNAADPNRSDGAGGYLGLVQEQIAAQQPARSPSSSASTPAPLAYPQFDIVFSGKVSAPPDPPALNAPPEGAEHPAGTGLVTASGAPLIVPNTEPSWDRRNCTGPEIFNPYYATSAAPEREGNVVGFSNWFQTVTLSSPGGEVAMPPAFSATAEAAQEALRLVREYVPDATVQPYRHATQVGDEISQAIVLPNGKWLNAGLLLDSYYHQGQGVDSNSDALLRQELGLPVA